MARILIDYFGFKNSDAVREKYGVTTTFLGLKLVYTDEELPTLQDRLGDLLNYIKNQDNLPWYYKSSRVIFDAGVLSPEDRWRRWTKEDQDLLVGFFELRTRFKRVIDKRIDDLHLREECTDF